MSFLSIASAWWIKGYCDVGDGLVRADFNGFAVEAAVIVLAANGSCLYGFVAVIILKLQTSHPQIILIVRKKLL